MIQLIKLSEYLDFDESLETDKRKIPTIYVKSKIERDSFMHEKRLQILSKIEQIKNKQAKKVEINCQTSKSPSEPKKKKVSMEQTQVSNSKCIPFKLHEYKVGQMVAIAYSDGWYPGQVLKIVKTNTAQIKFLHPLSSQYDVFQWPDIKDDISDVENIFVFFADFDVHAKDSKGRSWVIPNVNEIKSKYEEYKQMFFT